MTQTRGNKYEATCSLCGQLVAAGKGIAEPTGPIIGTSWVNGRKVPRRQWLVRHLPQVWVGSPVSGQWAHGCPTTTKKESAR